MIKPALIGPTNKPTPRRRQLATETPTVPGANDAITRSGRRSIYRQIDTAVIMTKVIKLYKANDRRLTDHVYQIAHR
jgi:hypothetical protein